MLVKTLKNLIHLPPQKIVSHQTLTVIAAGLVLPLAAIAADPISIAPGDVAGLIAAINTLNSSGGGTIELAPNGLYQVSAPSDWWYGPNAFPAISSAIVIEGNAATIQRVSGSPKFRFFYVSGGFSTLPAGNLTLHNLTLTGGLAQGGKGGTGGPGGGGGAGMGGAMYNQGVATLVSVTLNQNTAQGGSGGCCGGGSAGGGGIGGDGGSSTQYETENAAGGGGFRYAGQRGCYHEGPPCGNGHGSTAGGAFTGPEGGCGDAGCGGTSPYGGNGGSAPDGGGGGGGGGYTPGANGGTGSASGGAGAYAAGNGANGDGASGWGGGGGGAFGGGGGGSIEESGGGGGIGGGGGGGYLAAGSGGFAGGGGAGYYGGNGGFGGGGGATYLDRNAGSGGFGAAPGAEGNGTFGVYGGGGAGFGGAIFNHLGTLNVASSNLTGNSVIGGAGNGTAQGLGGAIANLNGSVTLDTITYSGNTATNSDSTPGSGAVVYNLSHDGGNIAAGLTSSASLSLIGTTISNTNGDLVNNPVNGTATVTSNVSAPVAVVSTDGLDFGEEPYGVTAGTQTVTLSNTGTIALSISQVSISSNFTIFSNNCGSLLAANASCQIALNATPPSASTFTGQLVIADNSYLSTTQTVELSVTGVAAPVAVITPSTLYIPDVAPGETSAPVTATIQNAGTAPLTINYITSGPGFNISSNCNTPVAAGASCQATITFSDNFLGLGYTGPVTTQLLISDNSFNSSSQTIDLIATVAVPSPSLFLGAPAALPFGSSGPVNLTLEGTGFAANATVNFGGVSLTPQSVSSNRMVVSVPASSLNSMSSAAVRVVNPAGGQSLASNALTIPITTSTSTLTFGRTDLFPLGVNEGVVVGDFNGDGKPDLAVASLADAAGSPYANTVNILLGMGDGTFKQSTTAVPNSSGPFGIVAGDFNNDGKLDLAIMNILDGTVSILLGAGDGTFSSASGSPIAVGLNPVAATAGDFNGDGNLDLAVVNRASSTVSILMGQGNGEFVLTATLQTGQGPVAIVSGDWNGDGLLDLAVSNQTGNTVSIFFGDGLGNFTAAATPLAAGNGPLGLAASDLDGDGNLDLVVASSGDNAVGVFFGDGKGNFAAATPLALAGSPTSVTIADFNGDGILDVAASTYGGTVTFLLGDGQRHFNALSPATTIAPEAQASAVADFNGDGRMDLVVATSCGMDTACGGSFSILLQSPVQSVSPPALVFPGQNPGTTSSSQPVTIANNGSAPLTVSAIAIAPGANTGAADFAQTNSCGTLPFKIASGASCVLAVTFSPSNGGGEETATLSITTNDPKSPNGATVSLSGIGNTFQTQMSVTAPAITYGANGSVIVAVTSPDGTVAGNVSLTVDGGNPQTLPLTAGSATFSITSPAGGTHNLSASFAAQNGFVAASATGSLVVNKAAPSVTFTGAPATAAYQSSFAVVAATNASSTPVITAAGPCTVSSTTVMITQSSGTCLLKASWPADNNFLAATASQSTVATKANPIVTFTGAPSSAAYGSKFSVTATTNDGTTASITAAGACSAAGLTIAITSGAGVCTLTANWRANSNFNSASAVQTTSAALAIPKTSITGVPASAVFGSSFNVTATSNASTSAVITTSGGCSNAASTITMSSGTGTCTVTASWPPDANYAAATASRSTIAKVAASTTIINSVTSNPSNVGQPVLVAFTVSGNGTPTGYVTVTASTGESCSSLLSAGAGSCSLTFGTGGSRTLIATYSGDQNFAAGKSARITMSVLQPKVKLSATSLIFASRKVGTTSTAKPVILTNSGTAPLAISALSITGDFALAPTTTCTGSTVLAPAAACSLDVTFTPTGTGTRTGSVNIVDNAPTSPQSIALSGTGS